MRSTPPVTFEDAEPYSNLRLPVFAFAEVSATTLDVSTTPVTISMTLE